MTVFSRSYTNPVFSEDVPDMGILPTRAGFFVYASQGEVDGAMQNIQLLFSHDLVNWERRGDALPEKAPWAAAQDYWAPDVVPAGDNDFRMFFNAKVDGSGQGIGVAVSTRPEGPFKVVGAPLVHGESYVNIDAKACQNPLDGKWYLLWGSAYEPIKIQELRGDLLGFARPHEKPIELLRPDPNNPLTKLYEAAWMTARRDEATGKTFFYLYTSGPDAFADKSYFVQVARSEEGPTSGFVTLAAATGRKDSIIYRSNDKFINPGASAITKDAVGDEWLVSHATLKSDVPDYDELKKDPAALWQKLRYTKRLMILDRLDYVDGWPTVLQGSPSVSPQAAPFFDGQKLSRPAFSVIK